ncbi:ribonuclease domain-containing protein [Enterococcus sp. RIT-PI-f]|uniref:ribonuclease domain-containing protein n=1 Tax=Enterococcus sp. RIT-PI-f TaxID=1690244 RepID=UPI0006B9D98E|nr:ribonuclease domain-containing protein [Enterococcus sp. RIT-PI-f]
MSIDMYVSSSQNQAASVSTMCKTQIEGYNDLQKAITVFVISSPFLSGKTYDSAKAYFQSVLYPLAQGGILLSEAVENAVKTFPEEYIAQVDSGDLKQSDLEEKISQVSGLLNQAEDIRKALISSKMPAISKLFQLTANSIIIGVYSDAKQKLEDQLQKLLAFNASSPAIFSEISSLQSAIDQGLSQASSSWNDATGTFTVPSDSSWKDTISEKWELYQDNLLGIDENKNKELEKYNVYAVIYTDMDGNPKISWQIEDKKTGYGITNPSLYRYLSKAGNYLDSDLIQFMTYEVYNEKIKDGWRNGVNYVTGEKLNPVLSGIVAGSQYVEDGYTWLNESELGQVIQILGFTYASYRLMTSSRKTTVGTSENASETKVTSVSNKKINDLPDNVKNLYKTYEKNEWEGNMQGQTPGTKAGGSYKNRDGKLPSADKGGNQISYEEFDVNNKLPNAKRDSERFVKGSDGSIYYTNDHYNNFLKIK